MADRRTDPKADVKYEVHVNRRQKWDVVEVADCREDAHAVVRSYRDKIGVTAIRVIAERFDEGRNLYLSSVVYEWSTRQKPAKAPPPPVFRDHYRGVERVVEAPPKLGWFDRVMIWLGIDE